LERFLFPPAQQYAPIHKLSGGEKRRLFLLRVLLEAPNVLILDEPTNDLDVQTLAVLEEYLESFQGCVLIVSHDRYFLDRTVDTIFAFENGGQLRHYPGNYSVYLEYQQQQDKSIGTQIQSELSVTTADSNIEANSAATASGTHQTKAVNHSTSPSTKAKPRSPQVKPRRLSYKERREYEALETRVPALEAEKAALEAQLYDAPPGGFEALQAMTEQLATLTTEIDQATERWLELAEYANN
ncbi:MAG: ATP-binding cassette domain-containing protein, partial [Cyanobacteria bacterium P01_H01_bin.121]